MANIEYAKVGAALPPPYGETTSHTAGGAGAAAAASLSTDDKEAKKTTYVWCLPKNAPRTWKEARTPFECGFCKKEVDALTKLGNELRWCRSCQEKCTGCPKCKEKTYWTDYESQTIVVIPPNTRASYSAYQKQTGVYYAVHGCVSCNFVKVLVPCGVCTVPVSSGTLTDGMLDPCSDCQYAERAKKPVYYDPGYATDCVVCGIGNHCIHGEKV